MKFSARRLGVRILICVEVYFCVVDTRCIPKPSGCYVPPEDTSRVNTTHVYNEIVTSVVSITQNSIFYAGKTAVFAVSIDRQGSDVKDTFPIAYVDGCRVDAPLCTRYEDGTRANITCTFENLTKSDIGKEICFYGFSPSLLTKACYNPPSYLAVLGPPSAVNVSLITDRCQGIIMVMESVIDPDTEVTYKLYNAENNRMLDSSTFNGTRKVVSPDLLVNHIGIYKVEFIPNNPAGDGPVFSKIVNLNKGKDSLHFIIHNVSLGIRSGDEFVAMVYIQVDKSCVLKIPNNFFVFSTCSGRHDRYTVDMKNIFDGDGIFVINHLLQPNKHNCTFFVADDVGNVRTFKSVESTFHTQSHVLNVNSDIIEVGCCFMKGSVAEGCWITVVQDDKIIREHLFPINGSNSVVPLGPFRPGKYTLAIHDCIIINGSKSFIPVIHDCFTVPVSTSVSSTSASSSPTTVQPTGGYDEDDRRRKHKKNNNTALILGVIAGVVVLIKLIVMTILLCCLWLKKTNKYFSHKSDDQQEDNTGRPETKENEISVASIPAQESVELRDLSSMADPCNAVLPFDNQTTNSKADHQEPSESLTTHQCHQTSAQVFLPSIVSSSLIIKDIGQVKSTTSFVTPPDARPDDEYGYSNPPVRGSSFGQGAVMRSQQVVADLKYNKEV